MRTPGCHADPGDRVIVHKLGPDYSSTLYPESLNPFGVVVENCPRQGGCLIRHDGYKEPFGWSYTEFNWVPRAGDRWEQWEAIVPAGYGSVVDWLIEGLDDPKKPPPPKIRRFGVVVLDVCLVENKVVFIERGKPRNCMEIRFFVQCSRRLIKVPNPSRYEVLTRG